MANDFGRDLDKYLDERQESRPTDFLIKRKQASKTPDEKVPDMDEGTVIVEGRDLTFFERMFKKRKEYPEIEEAIDTEIEKTEDLGELEEEYKELDEAEEAIEERKMSLFTRIMEKIRRSTIEENVELPPEEGAVVYDEDSFVVPDDLKDAMRIQNQWLTKLPHAQMSAFKSSEDFRRYQGILRKYGLIK